MPRTSVISSNVFRRSVIASGGYIALAMALVWMFGQVTFWQIDQEEWLALEDAVIDIVDEFEDEGLDAVITSRSLEGEAVWSDDTIFERLEDEEPLYVLRANEDAVLGGYGGLWPDEDDQLVWLDHPDIEDPLRALAFGLDEEVWGVVARFVPEREHYWRWLIPQVQYALLLVGLPLSLTIGYFLSRGVIGRIEAISDTAEAVASGRMQSRVALQGTGDEFDRLATKINDMLDQLAQLNRNIEAVSVGVAHDLKTPLANIGGRLELIRRDVGDGPATEAHVEAAEGYLAGLLRIFDALLRLGELETGRRRAAFGPLDLSDLVDETAAGYAALFEDARKTFATSVIPDAVVAGDRELLQQLLVNLLENALEHSRDAARVSLDLSFDGDAVLLRIGDDGPGISPSDRDRLFERFYRGDRSRGTPGNGLGLSLVKAIADLHDASVTLAEGAEGAVFEVRFPPLREGYETV
ncbi:MAG: HAMP domain-containing sensor histidine kinase [Pseudomonadota bacterium]